MPPKALAQHHMSPLRPLRPLAFLLCRLNGGAGDVLPDDLELEIIDPHAACSGEQNTEANVG